MPQLSKLVGYWIGTCFGIGRVRLAPGTAASFAALPVHWGLGLLPLPVHLTTIAVLLAAGVWSAGKVADIAGEHDPQIVVIDEVVGALLALAIARAESLAAQLVVVLLFRGLDIFKPWPIDWAETCKPAGVGIMADDVLAGLFAGIIFAVVELAWH